MKRTGRVRTALLALLVAASSRPSASASPNLSLDDPAYSELARLQASGLLPPYLGGLRPLTEARVQSLRIAAGLPPFPHLASNEPAGFWVDPLHEIRLSAGLFRDHLRPYSTDVHPRHLAGGVAISCERQQGRSCGDGAGLGWELDSAVGHGAWLSALTRVRLVAGTGDYPADAFLDRTYANAELGPLAVLVGRDVLILGPSARTQAMWGEHAPPLDHLRLSTSRPLAILGQGGSVLRASALFFLGRLRDPQVFAGALVDGTRIQVDFGNAVEVGLTHLIQMGGEGAPAFSIGDWILEHVRHKAGPPLSLGFANHRLAADLAITFPRLAGLRVYYEIAAEDMRKQIATVLRHDTDHVLGSEIDRLAPGLGLLLELSKTGVRSHEHQLFTTGMTHAGRITGHPLGPGTLAAFAGLRLEAGDVVLSPWLEIARQSSDAYDYGTGEIVRTEDLPEEWRARAGARASLEIEARLRVEGRALVERVTTSDLAPGRPRWNGGAEVTLTWRPDLTLVLR